MLRLSKFSFFGGTPEDALAQAFLVPTNGFNISSPTRHGLDNYNGPGTLFQGQLNLQLAKTITGPCCLRVVFSCSYTIPSSESLQNAETRLNSYSQDQKRGIQQALFEIDHILIKDEPMQIKRHTFMFNIKFPRVNFPASMMDGDLSVVFKLHGELTFQTIPGDTSTQSILLSPNVYLKYLPLVPTSIPHYPVTEMTEVMDMSTNQPLFKAVLESSQRGVCLGESLSLSLSITNFSDIELQSIHLSLVRVITYPTALASVTSNNDPSCISALTTDPVTVYTEIIPISKSPNKNASWLELIHFKAHSNLGLIPTTNKVITPLYKVDYYISISLPVSGRNMSSLASWFTPSVKIPPIDISLVHTAAGTTGTSTGVGTESGSDYSNLRIGSRKNSVEKNPKANTLTALKWPSLIQLPLIPVIIGTVSHNIPEKQLRWPIPSYLDVEDRPRFIRDRFEEEMMQHLESLETLIAEEEDEQHIEDLVQAAKMSAFFENEDDQRSRSKIPARFRNSGAKSRRKESLSSSGLDTPPPSPPLSSHASISENTARTGIHSLPRISRRSMSPKAGGLSKELLLEMHHSKVQQSLHAGLQDI
ncbi:hypothetical protein BGZ49_008063 [Haplosporangium sp. Z 27]|nr:hypothetical protein BGZ49_008063 [Haplosporangium sp. Z 27]